MTLLKASGRGDAPVCAVLADMSLVIDPLKYIGYVLVIIDEGLSVIL